jgi:hypothetical protein
MHSNRGARIDMYSDQYVLGSICTRINMYSGQEIKMYSVHNVLGSRYARNQYVLGSRDQYVLGSSDQYVRESIVLIYTRINMYAYQYFLCLRASGEPSLASPLSARLLERMFLGSWHSCTYFTGRIPILDFVGVRDSLCAPVGFQSCVCGPLEQKSVFGEFYRESVRSFFPREVEVPPGEEPRADRHALGHIIL